MLYLALGKIFENMLQFERILNRKWLLSYRNSDISSTRSF